MVEFRTELFIQHLPQTAIGLVIVSIAGLVYYFGNKSNSNRALGFYRKHKPLMVSRYGYMKTAILREAPSSHRAFLSGRENVEGTIVDYYDYPHQDILAYLGNIVVPFTPYHVICSRLKKMFPHTFLLCAKDSFSYLDSLNENYLDGLKFFDFGDFVIFTETAEIKTAYTDILSKYDLSGINFIHVADYDPEDILVDYVYIQSRGDFITSFNLETELVDFAGTTIFAHSAKKIDQIRLIMKRDEIEAEKEKKAIAAKKEKTQEQYERDMQRKMRRKNF